MNVYLARQHTPAARLRCILKRVERSSETSTTQTWPGLCQDCMHARRIESDRGSIFFLCQLALTDARFQKYPRLPVLSCIGYEQKPKSTV